MVRRPTTLESQLRQAKKEDCTRSRKLIESGLLRARLLGQRLAEHDERCPYHSAASAIAMCLAKPAALKRLTNYRPITHYKSITLIPQDGETLIDGFSIKRLAAIERNLRRALKRFGICRLRPGLFAFDFEYDSTRRMVIVHLHALIHRDDVARSKRLSKLPAFKSRKSCKYPIRRGIKEHPNGIEGFGDYMVKSFLTDRPSYPSPNSDYFKRGLPRRIRNPEFAILLLELDKLKPEDLIFRVGGGSGIH